MRIPLDARLANCVNLATAGRQRPRAEYDYRQCPCVSILVATLSYGCFWQASRTVGLPPRQNPGRHLKMKGADKAIKYEGVLKE